MRFKAKIIPVVLVLIILISGSVSAEDYDYTVNGKETVAIPKTYTYSYSINRTDITQGNIYFEQPSALMLGKDGYLYVADTGNNRVVKMLKDGSMTEVFTEASGKTFNAPQGVYANSDGTFYVADTGNGRIVYLDSSGECIKEYGLPESSMLSDVSVYSPTKIAPSQNGGLYVLMGETIMSVDSNNEFKGYIGQTDIGFSFKDWLLRLVASDEQKKVIAKRTASNYISFCIDDEGIIYATGYDTKEGEIKALNSVGINIYRKYGSIDGASNPLSDAFYNFFSGNIIGKSFRFGETVDGEFPTLSGITVDGNGIVTVIEKENGKLYQYDRAGNLLTVFGGLGTEKGKFGIPSDLTVDSDGKIYVLDSSNGNIQVFEPTEFIKTVQAATTAYYNGDYAASDALWNDVLATDSLYPLAHYGKGMTAYKSQNYKAAMEEFSYANYRSEYSKAFYKYRYEYMQERFGITVLIAALILTAVILAVKFLLKKSGKVLYEFEYCGIDRLSVTDGLWLGIACCFHPIRTVQSIKGAKKRLNLISALIFVLLAVAVRFFFIYTVHYPLQDVELYNVNITTEIIKLLLPCFTWTLSVYLITSQVNGEATFGETLIADIYCTVPYIFVIPFAALLSQVLCTNEKLLFAILVNGVVLLSMCLLVRTVMILNDYTIAKTFAVCIASAAVMILLWFVAILGYSLIERIIVFIKEIILESMLI